MTLLRDYPELQAIARDRTPRIALVLGSGLGDLADRLQDVVELPFGLAPGLETTGVAGHRGVLRLGSWSGVTLLVFAGRLHFYEGHAWRRVVQPIHIARELGASILLVTNAAGGIRDDLQPGDLMALCNHFDWTHGVVAYPVLSQDASGPYSPRLLGLLQAIDPKLPSGVYAQLTGPCYETPAEIRALRECGADAVGMSTAREIQAGFELGMECAAISCITNKAAGLSSGSLHHDEVLTTALTAKDRLTRLLDSFVARV